MQVVYAGEAFPQELSRSVFLAGPTPRHAHLPSWRPDALALLAASGFDGTVFVPEPADGRFGADYDGQIGWEWEGLALADSICFWVPRDLDSMPAMTTNVEYGLWAHSGKVVYGAPPEAPKNRYLAATASRLGISAHTTLADTLAAAVDCCGPPAARRGGERYVPLHIWRTPSFRSWYEAQLAVGNRLERARVEWCFPAAAPRQPFVWALHAEVRVAAEGRVKSNEVVLGRPDISVVAALIPAARLDDVVAVCVREFRTPVRNPSGFVLELPSGSAPGGAPGAAVAAHELFEETGLEIAPERFASHGSRQLAATLVSHHAHLHSVVLNDVEAAAARGGEGSVHGLEADSERTYVTLRRVGDLRRGTLMDWSMLAMVLEAAAAAVTG